MDEFKDSVKKGFFACKSDIESLKDENDNLKNKVNSLESNNSNLTTQLDEIKTEMHGLKIALDFIKNMKEEQVTTPSPQIQDPTPQKEISKKINELSRKSPDPYEALLAFKAKTNKRDLLKQKLISMIGESGMNLSELKFMFVEHFKYSSKATFYNYLKELEIERSVKVERENSKNYIYLTHMRKEI